VGKGEARQFIIDQIRAGSPLDASTIGSIIDAIVKSRGGISLFGLIFLIWSALGVFSAVSKGVAKAFAVSRPRPFWQDKLIGLLLMGGAGLLALVAIGIGLAEGDCQPRGNPDSR